MENDVRSRSYIITAKYGILGCGRLHNLVGPGRSSRRDRRRAPREVAAMAVVLGFAHPTLDPRRYQMKRSTSIKLAGSTVFVVPYFLNGEIAKIRVYSNVLVAQRALRRYVGYTALLREVRRKDAYLSGSRAMLYAYAAIERTPFAGTAVYEVPIDSRAPLVQSPRKAKRSR
jgi:hypothetical protein